MTLRLLGCDGSRSHFLPGERRLCIMQRKRLFHIPEPTFPLREGQLCTESCPCHLWACRSVCRGFWHIPESQRHEKSGVLLCIPSHQRSRQCSISINRPSPHCRNRPQSFKDAVGFLLKRGVHNLGPRNTQGWGAAGRGSVKPCNYMQKLPVMTSISQGRAQSVFTSQGGLVTQKYTRSPW